MNDASFKIHALKKRGEKNVTSRPVGQTNLNTVLGELVGVSSSHNNISRNLGVDDLSNNVLIGETNAKSVLGRVVLVLGLGYKALTGIVVRLAL
jgi:hypothetical protein